ncbi:MAG: tRNA 2-thiouridine(34) synthase MnmA [Candidatus Pacebacteria bacterium]|nr:tRNA 2-thiouridine(34) synthase MnmA [Candidatus Paceibacterota bacterium]
MKKVFVGLSGGVDSSVTAALLKKQGYDVTGVYIKGWYPSWIRCSWRESRRDAMRVCAKLDIPFLTLDLEKEYKKEVVDYFLEEYKKGNTPNPDIMCNKYIKFGSFFDFAMGNGADFVATGHYAISKDSKLYRGKDNEKDQSYFLWTISKEKLPKITFPLGEYQKKETRKLAKEFGLPTSEKKDSQGICFLEDISMEEFLKYYFPPKEGNVLDPEGNVIGTHEGSIYYTIGQRRGFTTSQNMQAFVISKDMEKNTITVSEKRPERNSGDILLHKENWITVPEEGKEYTFQSRYRQKPTRCRISGNKLEILEKSDTPTSGQSIVVYAGDECLGGGII